MLDLTFKVDISRLVADGRRFGRRLSMGAVLAPGLKQAAARYMGFIRRRFIAASQGDGTWPDLAPSTKLARMRKTKAGQAKLARARKQMKELQNVNAALGQGRLRGARRMENLVELTGSSFAILRDTNTLFGSLSLGTPTSIQRVEAKAVEVGTAVKYAKYHQDPTRPGRPPQREILVDPDQETRELMATDLQRSIDRAA